MRTLSFVERGAGKLELLRGDIIVLDDESKKNVESGWMSGVNDRTNREGEFPVDIVYIIPCTSKPESKVLVTRIRGENVFTLNELHLFLFI